jgi:hypothetical protein
MQSRQSRPDSQSEQAYDPKSERAAIAQMLMKLFSHWKLSTELQLAMLGLATNNRRALHDYEKGKPLGPGRDLQERAGHLLGIHKNLRLLFPDNPELAYSWMTTRNAAFNGMTPAETIRDYGFAGLYMVKSYLDRARGS